jgi:tetratricopeptide (TPR) repeat protein
VDAGTAIAGVLLLVVIGGVLGAYLGGRVIGPWIGQKLGNALTGARANGIIMRPQYGRAETFYKKGHYAESLAEYRKVFEQYPEDVYAHVRIAEILIQHFKNPTDAATELEAALPHTRKGENRAFLLNRLADVCLENLHDHDRACAALQRIVEDMRNTKWCTQAEDRIAALTRKQKGGLTPSQGETGYEIKL